MPSEHVRALYKAIAPLLHAEQILVSATKGIEDHTHLRISEIIAQTVAQTGRDERVGRSFSPDASVQSRGGASTPELHPSPFQIAVLSGPSFAAEVAAGLPTALTLACPDPAITEQLQHTFTSPSLRVYTNEDVIGVELGGALKNVIAIASGIASGLNLGHNATAALITRGIAEVTRLAVACVDDAKPFPASPASATWC